MQMRVLTLALQGSYSNWDYDVDAIWYTDWLIHGQRDAAVARWQTLNLSLSNLTQETDVSQFYQRTTLDLAVKVYKSKLAGLLETDEPSDVTSQQIDVGVYAPLVRSLALSWANERTNRTLRVAGHSLGGGLAQLAHLALVQETQFAQVQTVTFAATGVKCLLDVGSLEDAGLNYDTSIAYQITDYVDKLDVIGLFGEFAQSSHVCACVTLSVSDYQLGSTCFFMPENLTTAIEWCGQVLALETSLFLELPPGASDISVEFIQCRFFTHSIYHLYRVTRLGSAVAQLNDDGTTTQGCVPWTLSVCPSYSADALYDVLFILHVIAGLIVLAVIITGITCCVLACCNSDRAPKRLRDCCSCAPCHRVKASSPEAVEMF
jgi:hypothetical protein